VPALAGLHNKLPRNANGKVDRKALSVPETAPRNDQDGGEAEVDDHLTDTEKDLREVWSEVLKVPPQKIRLEDSFFAALGGNSLLAGRATALLRRKFCIDLPGTMMYTYSSIKKLGLQVDRLRSEQLSSSSDEESSSKDSGLVLLSNKFTEYQGYSCTAPAALLFQSFGVILVEIVQDFGPQAIVYCALGYAYYYYGVRWWMPLFMTAVALTELLVMALFTVAVKWLALGRARPGSYPLWGSVHLRWWLTDRFLEDAHDLLGLLAETSLLTAWYRMMGAKIEGGSRLNHPKITTPDLVNIGKGVEVHRNVTIGSAAVYGGMLHLQEVTLGDKCELDPGSYAAPGTCMRPSHRLLPMATSPGQFGGVPGSVMPIEPVRRDTYQRHADEKAAARFWLQQDMLRMFLGLPWVACLLATPNLAAIITLDWAWALCEVSLPKAWRWPLFWYLLVPIVITHAFSFFLIIVVVLQKRLLVGCLNPGLQLGPPSSCSCCTSKAWRQAHWDTLRHWLHARGVTARLFEQALEPLVNSELLSCVHRLLGAKVGRRVQSDNFKAVEHDCIQIEDFTVFGSAVTMNCDASCRDEPWRRELRPVRLLRASNCLDHSQLMPGVVVGEAAVLGTRTLAHEEACFPPDSISTGAISGRSVLLRTEASASAPPKDRAEELRVMQKLESPLNWAAFNAAQLGSAFVAYALPQLAWVIATSVVFIIDEDLKLNHSSKLVNDGSDPAADRTAMELASAYWGIWLLAFFAVEVGLLMLACAMKWAVMGEYKEGNNAFFSGFHYRWAIMLNFKGAMAPLADHLAGTAFQNGYYRLMGAKIGRNAYLSGIALEFDLLEVGDGAAINDDCDATAHTVERMVLKMAPVRIEPSSAMLPGSVVMPGGLLEKGALLLERSQVLKGDVVRAGEVWAGQPAQKIVHGVAAAGRAVADQQFGG